MGISSRELVGISILCDKYDAVRLLRPVSTILCSLLVPSILRLQKCLRLALVTHWTIADLLVTQWFPSWVSKLQQARPVCDPGNEKWLWVAWVYGDKEIYQKLSKHMVQSPYAEAFEHLSDDMPPGAVGKPLPRVQANPEADSSL